MDGLAEGTTWGKTKTRAHFGHTALEAAPKYVAAKVHEARASRGEVVGCCCLLLAAADAVRAR